YLHPGCLLGFLYRICFNINCSNVGILSFNCNSVLGHYASDILIIHLSIFSSIFDLYSSTDSNSLSTNDWFNSIASCTSRTRSSRVTITFYPRYQIREPERLSVPFPSLPPAYP